MVLEAPCGLVRFKVLVVREDFVGWLSSVIVVIENVVVGIFVVLEACCDLAGSEILVGSYSLWAEKTYLILEFQ